MRETVGHHTESDPNVTITARPTSPGRVRLRKALTLLSVPLPWRLRRPLLERLLGYELHPTARIGVSWIAPRELVLKEGASISHFSICRNLDRLELGESAVIGSFNWITGGASPETGHFAEEERDRALILGDHAGLTSRHIVDCTNLVEIGRFSTVAGYRSLLMTHSIDLELSRQVSAAIRVGEYCFVGARCTLLAGSQLPDYSVLAAGSVLVEAYDETHRLYAGVPARPQKQLAADLLYFARRHGYVL